MTTSMLFTVLFILFPIADGQAETKGTPCLKRWPSKADAIKCAAKVLCGDCSVNIEKSEVGHYPTGSQAFRIVLPVNSVVKSKVDPPIDGEFQLNQQLETSSVRLLGEAKIGGFQLRSGATVLVTPQMEFGKIEIPSRLQKILLPSQVVVSEIDVNRDRTFASAFETKVLITLCGKQIPKGSHARVYSDSEVMTSISFKAKYAVEKEVPGALCTFYVQNRGECQVECEENGLVPESKVNPKAVDRNVPY